MKPNFHNNQIKPEYVENIKWDPSDESMEAILEIKYNNTESVSHSLNWQATSQHNIKYIREYLAIAAFIVPYYFLCSTKAFGNDFTPLLNGPYVATLLLSISIMYTFWSSLGGFVFDYCFSEECIAVRRYNNEPEWTYKFARFIGGFGIAACIILAIVFSPMIFVGAGGFALLAFKMVNMKRTPFYQIVPYDSILYISYYAKNDELNIYYKEPSFDKNDHKITIYEEVTCIEMFLRGRSMNKIIELINKKVGYEVEYSEFETFESGPNFFDRATEAGTPLHRVTINRETHEMEYSTHTENYVRET